MINWCNDYSMLTNTQEYMNNETPAQAIERHSYVYTWLPWRLYDSTVLTTNYNYIHNLEVNNIKTRAAINTATIPNNNEIQSWITTYLAYWAGPSAVDTQTWASTRGWYLSRVQPDGGVAKMLELVANAKCYYDEVYVTTPTMITNASTLRDWQQTEFFAMIMGEKPVATEFDNYVAQYKSQGGDKILQEVNTWFASTK
jgi:hypothetical protein